MKEKTKLSRIIFIIGVIALIVGAIDPLEGSVLLVAGCALITLSMYMTRDPHWKIFASCLALIGIGVFFLFYFSSLGGFGGTSSLSWWWGTLILPYPIGWLIAIVTLIVRVVRKSRSFA
jgi:hypothetical protein